MIAKARRLRFLAEARLGMIRAISNIESKMLDGTLEKGDFCHDIVFRAMVQMQNHHKYPVRWNRWRAPSEDERKFQETLHKELESNGEVALIVRSFMQYYFRAFRLEKPFAFFTFSLWVFTRSLKDNMEEWLLAERIREP